MPFKFGKLMTPYNQIPSKFFPKIWFKFGPGLAKLFLHITIC